MSLSVRRLSSLVDEQIAQLRAAEREVTMLERLRWQGETIVAEGRGYLLSGDPALFIKLEDSTDRFDENVRALRASAGSLVAEVDQAANNFWRVQKELMTARQRSNDAQMFIDRFEAELLPLRHRLELSLDRLVEAKEAALDGSYVTARTNRARLELWLDVLRALLVLAGLAIAWYLAAQLGRSYRREFEAKETAQKAVAARDEVMGMVAHDLRSPLGAITMRAALLEKSANPENVRKQAESIQNVARRMEYLIQTMLDVATMDASEFSVSPTPCSVEGLLHETKAMFDPIARSKQIGFESRGSEPTLRSRGSASACFRCSRTWSLTR
jgi:signal transduction histidine kinase